MIHVTDLHATIASMGGAKMGKYNYTHWAYDVIETLMHTSLLQQSRVPSVK